MRVKLLFDIETYNYKLTSCCKNYESMLSEKFKLTAKFALASALSFFRGPVAGEKMVLELHRVIGKWEPLKNNKENGKGC